MNKMLEHYYKILKVRHTWGERSHADIADECVKVGQDHSVSLQLQLDDAEVIIDGFRQYAAYRANDGWDNILAVERTGTFVLYESPKYKIIYQVKIDLVVQLQNMPVCGVDHKTSSRRNFDVIGPDGTTFAPESLSNQFKGYCVALGTNTFIKNSIGLQKTLAPKEKFTRHLISYPNSILEEWNEESAGWLIRAYENKQAGIYPRNYTSCDKYSGCTFRSICQAEPELRQMKLDTYFNKKDKWDVGKDL
jgi:hypothetical protein